MKKKETVRASKAKYEKEKTAFNKKVLGMGFEDFKKVVVKNMFAFEDEVVKTFSWTADQRDALVGALRKTHKQIWKDLEVVGKNIKTLDERLLTLEGFTAMFAIKAKERWRQSPMTLKEKKELAKFLSIRWGEKEEKALEATRH